VGPAAAASAPRSRRGVRARLPTASQTNRHRRHRHACGERSCERHRRTSHRHAWIKAGLPWVLALALSSGVACMMNTAVVQALSTNRASDAASIVAQDMSIPCALDVDDALYAGSDVWQPAGRSTFCRAERYPGDSGRKDGASQLVRVGPLLATIPSLLQPTSASTCIVRHAHGSVQPKLSCQRWTHVTCTNRSARQPARHHRATLPPVLPLRSRTRRCRSRSPS
jgi:hypothetical protein